MDHLSNKSTPAIFADRRARDWVGGFLLAGILMGVLGSLVVAWQYQLDTDGRWVGLHFLGMNAGVLVAGFCTQRLLRKWSIRAGCLLGCLVASTGFVSLVLTPPPMQIWWRVAGVTLLGCGAGILLTALFHLVKPYYEEDAAATVNFAGLLFGLGCCLATFLVGVVYRLSYSIQWETILLAVIPLAFFVLYWRREPPAVMSVKEALPVDRTLNHSVLNDLRSIAAVLFSLLLFFQFGNEWALASWLPLFLIHRLGSSPVSAIFVLAAYFVSLLLGRFIAQLLLAHVSHTRLLVTSITAAMFGYLLLSSTNSLLGAAAAAVLTGLSLAPVYPLVAEKIGRRFDYEPGFFNGIFSVAIMGGMLAPWLLGYVEHYLGMRYVLLLPAFGTVAVLILMLLLMLEAKLMGTPDRPSNPGSRQEQESRSVSRNGI